MTEGMTLSRMLAIVATELETVGADGRVLEHRVGDAVDAGDPGQVILSLQGLDHLMQVIDGLALFLRCVSEQVEPTQQVDPAPAAQLVGLRALAERLRGQEATPVAQAPDGDEDLHLF